MKVVHVDKWALRRIFNEAGYIDRLHSGEFTEHLLTSGPPDRKLKEPPGTRSERYEWRDRNGRRVAVVHQYVRRDGSLGASGKPDPKRVWLNGTLYVLSTSEWPALRRRPWRSTSR